MKETKIPTANDLCWSFNDPKTLYKWRVKGGHQRKTTKSRATKGLPVEYDDDGNIKPKPSKDNVNEWIKLYFHDGHLIENAIELMDDKEIKNATINNYKIRLKDFCLWLDKYYPEIQYVAQVNQEHTSKYTTFIRSKPLMNTGCRISNGTADTYCKTLRALFKKIAKKTAIQNGENTPFGDYEKCDNAREKKERLEDKYFTEEESFWILKNLKEQGYDDPYLGNLYHICMMQHYTGCRISDACTMKTKCIDLDEAMITYAPFKTLKHGNTAIVPIEDQEFYDYLDSLESIKNGDTFVSESDAFRYLQVKSIPQALKTMTLDTDEYKEGKRNTTKYNDRFADFLEKLPLPGQEGIPEDKLKYFKPRADLKEGFQKRECLLNTHAIRHGYGVRKAYEDVPLKIISERMGHSNIKQTEQYLRHKNKDQQKKYSLKSKSKQPIPMEMPVYSDSTLILNQMTQCNYIMQLYELIDQLRELTDDKRMLGILDQMDECDDMRQMFKFTKQIRSIGA